MLYSTEDRTDFVTWVDIILIVLNLACAIFGAASCWTDSMEARKEQDPEIFDPFYQLADRMIYIRLIVLIIPACMVICVLLIVLVTWVTGSEDDEDEDDKIVNKLPLPSIISKFL